MNDNLCLNNPKTLCNGQIRENQQESSSNQKTELKGLSRAILYNFTNETERSKGKGLSVDVPTEGEMQ